MKTCKIQKRKLENIQEKYGRFLRENGTTLMENENKSVHEVFQQISENVTSIFPENAPAQTLWDEQVKANKFKSTKSMRWHPG